LLAEEQTNQHYVKEYHAAGAVSHMYHKNHFVKAWIDSLMEQSRFVLGEEIDEHRE